jgi:hypothetical protein
MKINFTPSNENAFGVAMLAGRVVGTVQGSDGHITVRATCKAKSEGGRWNTVPFEKATHVFFDVPSAEGEWADKIGTFYPAHSSGKWAGHFFEDRAQSDSRRIAAAKYLMRTTAGEIEGAHILKSERCARCSKELTHPDSIFAMFGPECVKKVAAYMPNRSGTPEGAHSKKIADRPTTPIDEVLPDLTDDELTQAIEKASERYLRDSSKDNERRVTKLAAEISRRQKAPRSMRREDFETNDVEGAASFEHSHGRIDDTPPGMQAWARRFAQHSPPQPSAAPRERVEKPEAAVERVDDTIVATLRKGDDPKVVLQALDA